MKNRYFPTAVGLYFNYFVHGMGVILMSLNMSSLEQQWHTSAAGVSIVISSLGIGRLSVLLIAGMLSDRFGRRPFIILGTACYLIFFIGILYAQTIFVAYACGFLAGMANSFLDAGTYPSLMEAFPRSPSTANILIKAFVSGGQFLLPIIISLLVWANMWFGWSFLLAGAIMLINALFLLRCPFPPYPGRILKPKISQAPVTGVHHCSLIDLISYTLYGYISMATFYLLSIYTCGSLLCVFITAPLVRKTIRSTTLLMFYTFISFIALLTVCLHPQTYIVMIFAFVIGFSSAGGVVQIGLTLMASRFPQEKGKATGIYYSAGSIATFTIPLITARISEMSIAHIMWFDTGIAAAGFLLALFIGYRSRAESQHHAEAASTAQ
ncbi:MFS transporter [Salmonella enterica]|uniref:MFS transporter n=7 Tax=Salmonella enterica TaxID=28901 RepID=A0A3Z2MWV2_SALET|nr:MULTISPECIES: MFS transporter [Salmonella]EAW2025897.1 MFS transporter [Salmonella enterica subsp. enterica]ECA3045605.1 MFS transporter [Salmonella enterica subsp. enterica serovar Rostock]ECG8141984.1 MFS transporter [Salmonella enterica subsp. enterica serovar Choleraesuis]ECM7121108.1 MFS transporter [Salmonella enterica subsp. enterica serovar Typhimurium]EDP9756438.1 MFS transporter [Salmonella enterica subsp. enterica serovar Oranienburg]EDS7341324.1 MFS transporter [Salmonella ente